MNRTILSFIILLSAIGSRAGSLEDLRLALQQSSVTQIQEKVYVHTDNTCYFVGDTLWYKAYVVRADNLCPTDMSHILYVELLSPDGLLVERQNIIVAPEGYTCGQFVLQDSLYSGYYELRAYTRWNLNFNQREHRFDKEDGWAFYNRQMARDYYRLWDGLYSRVLPIYSKPDEAGDYDERRMYQRPKTRIPRPKKDNLLVTFFPEGGNLVEGLQSRVAFEAVDQHGQAVDIKGTVWAGNQKVADIATGYMGRGSFNVTPGAQRLKVRFRWHDKDYSFDLPKAETAGAVMTLDGGRLTIQGRALPQDRQYAVSILCRGALKYFEAVNLSPSAQYAATLSLPVDRLPAGVNDVTLFDSEGQILADRLFFVGGTDGASGAKGNIEPITDINPLRSTTTYAPYEPITIGLQLPTPETTFSLAVRDTRTDEPSYDDGNLMTSMLLSSELRGFIARPAYYFESDDAEHRQNLDLLMMVQGWRRYKWKELADTAFVPQYEPETTMTVSGAVYKMLGIIPVGDLPIESPMGISEVGEWASGRFTGGENRYKKSSTQTSDAEESETLSDAEIGAESYGNDSGQDVTAYSGPLTEDASSLLGVNHSGLRHEVMVEAELYLEDGMVAAVQKTHDGGRFVFEIPPFYGTTFLNMKAYKEKDTLRKAMTARGDKEYFREDAFADYYVKRDMPYPVFTDDYNFYQNHAPEWDPSMEEADTLSLLSMENDYHQLRNVDVKGRRRGRRATDWTKPAFVRDAYDLYNDLTDYGLSYGKYDMRMFPQQVARFLYGNMGRHTKVNVDGRLNGRIYWRNYDVTGSITDTEWGQDMAAEIQSSNQMRAPQAIYDDLLLARLQNVRIYSDYEPRKEDSLMVESHYIADMTVEMEPIADDGRQVVFRDRHIYLHGMSEPADFYQPDYSQRPVDAKPADYRRTLYWNPNARTDEDGRFVTTFYNNGKDTRIKISAAGVTPDGRLLFSK